MATKRVALCGLLRLSWISCLFLNTVNSFPTQREASGSNKVAQGDSNFNQLSSSGYPNAGSLGRSSSPSSALYSTSLQPSSSGALFKGSEFDSGPSSLQPETSSTEYMYYAGAPGGGYDVPQTDSYSTEEGPGGAAYYAYPYHGYYDSNAHSNVGYDGLTSVDAGYPTNYGSVNGDTGFDGEFYMELDSPEPVFSDVSDLDPVSSFSARSSYQRGRAVYSQTTYTPGEVLPPNTLLSRDPHMGSLKQPGRHTKRGF